MAKGRMIVKSIAWDRRLWKMPHDSILIFLCTIPHIGSDGTILRAPETLKDICFPCADFTEQQIEQAILNWLKTNPPIAKETTNKWGEKCLFFNDFERANEGLNFMRVRKHRKQNVTGVTKKSYCNSNFRIEENRIEEKRRKGVQRGKKSPLQSQKDFLNALRENPAYSGIDIDRELAKMDAWLLTHKNKKKTPRFIVNWLNRIEKPLPSGPIAVKIAGRELVDG